MTESLDIDKLEQEVKQVYRSVAREPQDDYHFEMGRDLAERLGYPPEDLDPVPTEALESFAGVGYHFDLANVNEGDSVLDLGSGSATDVFFTAMKVGGEGRVIGIDMTDEQLAKARELRDTEGFSNVSFDKGYIEDLPFGDGVFDAVISNGVINLSPDKDHVFSEAYRVLSDGGVLTVSDITSEKRMPDSIKNNADLWASCIGGAMQIDDYTGLIESVGFGVEEVRDNPEYEFVSDAARGACEKYGIKSVSLKAVKD